MHDMPAAVGSSRFMRHGVNDADFNITPDVAIVDPALAETMPKKLTAHTGMDAMTHAIEAYVSTLKPIKEAISP